MAAIVRLHPTQKLPRADRYVLIGRAGNQIAAMGVAGAAQFYPPLSNTLGEALARSKMWARAHDVTTIFVQDSAFASKVA